MHQEDRVPLQASSGMQEESYTSFAFCQSNLQLDRLCPSRLWGAILSMTWVMMSQCFSKEPGHHQGPRRSGIREACVGVVESRFCFYSPC